MTPDEMRHVLAIYQTTKGLTPDGIYGPNTAKTIETSLRCISPIKPLVGGRSAVVTSAFKSKNPSRPNHNGVDLFFHYLPTDPSVPTNRGLIRRGNRTWWIPVGTQAVAPAAGVVTDVRPNHNTGGLVWVRWDARPWLRFGFMHLESCEVLVGQHVEPGDAIGLVGHNPSDSANLVHLHFEVSAVDKYDPTDPEEYVDF